MTRSQSLLLGVLWLAGAAVAQETVFYKCTDANGAVTVQNGTPCAPGMRQEVRRVGGVQGAAAPAATPPAATPATPPQYGEFVQVAGPRVARTPAPEAASLPAPPALYQCRTWDGKTYYGETDQPPPRCMPLQVVGLDGTPTPELGQACEMRRDDCTAVPEAQLCDAWYRRLDEAEFRLEYAEPAQRRARQAEFNALRAQVMGSRCATTVPAAPAASSSSPRR